MVFRRDPSLLLSGRDAGQYSWRPVGLFFFAYFGAYLGAAILSPVIYWIVQSVPASGEPASIVHYLQSHAFPKYVDRSRLVFTAIFLVLLIRYCGIWGRFGFFWRRSGTLWQFTGFMAIGLVSMGLIVAGQSLLSGVEPRNPFSLSQIVWILFISFAGAIIIGWLEEAVFRGMLLRMVYTAVDPILAVLLSSLIFAAVHFKKVPWLDGIHVDWLSGLYVASLQSVSFLFSVEWLVFWNYVLVGLILNIVFLRTQSLIGCMGLHAGWVMARNSWRKLVDIPRDGTHQFWGTERIVDGYACLLILSLIAVFLYVEWRHHQSKEAALVESVS